MAEATYTNEYSQLPDSVLPERKFLDVTNDIAEYVNKIKTYQAEGKYSEAASLIQSYQQKGINLKDYVIDSTFINLLEEETRNLEIYCKSQKQGIYYSQSEPIAVYTDIWIGP